MAEQKHTPGPWVVSRESNEWNSPTAPRREIDALKACEFGGEPTRYRLACVQYPPTQAGTMGAQEREANARLIAAAPDLLAALKEALSELATEYPIASRLAGNWPEMVPVFERINAAIAKAEGR